MDAGFDDHKNKFSVGIVVRDFKGQVRGASACNIRHHESMKGAKLHAIRHGMEFCLCFGLTGICIFSYCTQAINPFVEPMADLRPNGTLALEIHTLMDPDIFFSLFLGC